MRWSTNCFSVCRSPCIADASRWSVI